MYKQNPIGQQNFENFYIPFGGQISSDNRWVKLSKLVPWDKAEDLYRKQFSTDTGSPAKPLRVALGALIIKERCRFTDEETVLQIQENPYLQFFIGYKEYSAEPPFDPSLMVHFRKRLDLDFLNKINEIIIQEASQDEDQEDDNDNNSGLKNKGKLIVDATCTPADIRYPTDVGLLNEAREKSEEIIDVLHEPNIGKSKKPRTYRKKARKDFLSFIKRKKKGKGLVRKATRKQLGYLRRNLAYIHGLLEDGKVSLELLSKRKFKNLLVITELLRQQTIMFEEKVHKVEGRIVSVAQPHIRPIVRGKSGRPVEFGAKLSMSLVNGFSRIEHFSWDNYHEGILLIDHIKNYFEIHGYYPESVHVDQIYSNRENRKYCKENNIRLSGPPLGRPPKDVKKSLANRKLASQDMRDRIPSEGKFGEGKRKYGLGLIMAKLSNTSESVVGINNIVMNLEKRMRILLNFIFKKFRFQIFMKTFQF